ncbi:MAG TPA: YtxH domain-containing protein [Anaerolineaceae bacterium]|jgi:gas vesicle protein|nr:YtxH domain-containing protein [Anaerolineales bacterium]HQK42742.1 YtxH domain-containing protein [Anaerolineaceae bacterium]
MSESNNFGSFVMGFVVGALSGAIASLLLAPQTGEETRQLIKDKTIELSEKGSATFEETKKKAEEAYKEALAKAQEVGAEAAEKVTETVKKVKKTVEVPAADAPEAPEL